MERKNWVHSGTLKQQPSQREIAHGRLVREMAAEGMVLLKNEGLLPLKESTSIVLLGCGAGKTVKGGIGSGDVNNRENISIYEGLKEAGVSITSENWLADYECRYTNARNEWKEKVLEDAKGVENVFDAYAANPFVLPEGRPVSKQDIEHAEAAVYVISRISGEGKDRRRIEGDYYLSKREREDILYLNQENVPTVLILNAGGPVELTEILQQAENIKAVLQISQPGQEGGHAVADVLLGKTVPGGRLTATWAKRYEDYPCAETFSYLNGNLETEEYKEGIYVGYRYFDSFGVEPLFPFGYGLSYTTFAYSNLQISNTTPTEKDTITVSVDVTNTGNVAGKEVVQLYVKDMTSSAIRPEKELKGFEKVQLAPGETKTVTMELNKRSFAWYNTELHDWYAASGKYEILIGASSRDIRLSETIELSSSQVIPMHVHMNTTLGELLRHPKTKETAKELTSKYLSAMNGGSETASESAAEAISEEMVEAMTDSMPLRSLCSFGGFSRAEIQEIIDKLQVLC